MTDDESADLAKLEGKYRGTIALGSEAMTVAQEMEALELMKVAGITGPLVGKPMTEEPKPDMPRTDNVLPFKVPDSVYEEDPK